MTTPPHPSPSRTLEERRPQTDFDILCITAARIRRIIDSKTPRLREEIGIALDDVQTFYLNDRAMTKRA